MARIFVRVCRPVKPDVRPCPREEHHIGEQRRTYTDDFNAAAVDRLYEPGATQGSVCKDIGITGTQLKTWRFEIEAFGSAEAKRRQKSEVHRRVGRVVIVPEGSPEDSGSNPCDRLLKK
ncbi:MAG: transposase [Roseovarius sp.]|nr:transposase [Roseovarius sp.]